MSEPGARLVLTQGLVLRPRLTAFLARRPAPIITLGFDVLVQLVIAATTTDPCVEPLEARRHRRRGGHGRGGRSGRAAARRGSCAAFGFRSVSITCERLLEPELGLPERDAILRTLGSGEAGLDGGQIELDRRRVDRLDGVVGAEEPLLLRVRLDQPDLRIVAAGEPQVVERHVVDRTDRDGRAVLGRHVAERRAIGDGQELQARPEELDELSDHAELAELLGDRQHEVGRGRPFGQPIDEPEADDFRNEHRDRLPEHGGFGLDAADAPAHDAEAVDHRRVRVGADERVGIGEQASVDAVP